MISALLTSSVLILVILLLRKMLRGKVGDGFLYALWLVVAVRLLMPVPEFFLEKVAGIEKPWVSSSVSIMNLAAGLADNWENNIAGQQEKQSEYSAEDTEKTSAGEQEKLFGEEAEKTSAGEQEKLSGEEAEKISAGEQEKLSGEKTEDSLLEKSNTEKGTAWQPEKKSEEKNTDMSQNDAMNGEKPKMQENKICNKKFWGGGGSLSNFLQAPWLK